MRIEEYGGVLLEIIEAVEVGATIRRIVVTPEEMDEIQFGTAWRQAVSKYYGDAKPVMDQIVTDRDGKFLSFYFENVLVALEYPEVELPSDNVDYPPIMIEDMGTSMFTKESPSGDPVMLVGIGNPANHFVYGFNDNIEMGITAHRYQSKEFFGAGENFDIELDEHQDWNFGITVGSLNTEYPNITDLYDVQLILQHSPTVQQIWTLRWVSGKQNGVLVQNYMWYEGPTPVITDSATDNDFRCTQMIQRYRFPFIKPYLPADTEYNEAGSPLGTYEIKLVATPKRKGFEPSEVVVGINVTKKD